MNKRDFIKDIDSYTLVKTRIIYLEAVLKPIEFGRGEELAKELNSLVILSKLTKAELYKLRMFKYGYGIKTVNEHNVPYLIRYKENLEAYKNPTI